MSWPKLFAILVALSAIALLIPVALANHGTDPKSVVEDVIAAVNAGDVDTTADLFADDAVVTLVGFAPGGPLILTGKERIRRGFVQSSVDVNVLVEIVGDIAISEDKATWVNAVTNDRTRQLGIAPIQQNGEAVVQEGKIKFFSLTVSPESAARIAEAVAAQTEAYTAALQANASGSVVIRDSDDTDYSGRLSDMATITMTGVPLTPPTLALEGWFVSDDGSRVQSTGILQVDANGTVNQAFALAGFVPIQVPPPEEIPGVVTFTGVDVVEEGQHGHIFQGPDTIAGGWTTIRLVNHSFDVHQIQLIKLPEGLTAQGLVDAFLEGGDPAGIEPAGGPATIQPFASSTATMNLEPGDYALFCFVEGNDGLPHFAIGMWKALSVTADGGAPEPTADFTVDMSDTGFSIPVPITAGTQTVRVNNTGTQRLFVDTLKLAPGATSLDFLGFFAPGAQPEGPPPGAPVGGIMAIAPGDHGYFTASFTPGNHFFLTFLEEAPSPGGPPFVVQEFTVAGQIPAVDPADPLSVVQVYIAALNAGDIIALESLYTDDAVSSFLGGPEPETHTGKTAILGNEAGDIADNLQVTISNTTVIGSVVRGNFSATLNFIQAFGLPPLTGTLEVTVSSAGEITNFVVTNDESSNQRLLEVFGAAGPAPTGENLFADFNTFVVSIEPVPDLDPLPSADKPLIHTIPAGGILHIRHLTYSWQGNPPYAVGFHAGTPKGIAVGLREQAWAAWLHADLSLNSTTLAYAKAHAEHVVNIIEGSTGTNFGDLDGDGSTQNPGDGFGVLNYAADTVAHAGLSASAAADDPVIVRHAQEAVDSANNVWAWTKDARDGALDAQSAPDLLTFQLIMQNVQTILNRAFWGFDADADGTAGRIPGEGGAVQAYWAAQDMGQYLLTPPAAPPADEDPPVEPPVTGDTNVPNMALAALVIGAFLLLSGAYIWRRSRKMDA